MIYDRLKRGHEQEKRDFVSFLSGKLMNALNFRRRGDVKRVLVIVSLPERDVIRGKPLVEAFFIHLYIGVWIFSRDAKRDEVIL